MNDDVLVSVICLAYNHEKYICQAMDSILSQKTDFKYEVIVSEDCSTDNTAKILREYESKDDKLKVIYFQENQHTKGIPKLPKLIDMAKGELLAFCECDDYFCDEYKLQKQVDLLRKHPDCVACIHSAYRVSENGNKIGYKRPRTTKEIMGMKEIIPCLGESLYALNSLMCYKKALADYFDNPLYLCKCGVGDMPLALYLAFKGNFIYSEGNMAAYRVNSIGSWSQRMSRDSVAAIKTLNRFIELMKELDRMTHGSFHKEVCERMNYFEFMKAYNEKNYSKYMSVEYKVYRERRPLKQRLNFSLKCFVKYVKQIVCGTRKSADEL